MIPYLLLLFIPFLCGFIAVGGKKNRAYLYCGTGEYVKERNLTLPLFFIILFFLLALRDISIGNDTANYKYYFDLFRVSSIDNILNKENEVLYAVLCWAIGQITDNYQWFLASVAAITLIPIATFYMEERKHSYLKMILFLNMSTFIMLFSGIRQSIAFSIGLLAFNFVRKKKVFLFLICVVIAMGFHQSAFILLIMYPLYYITFRKKHLFLIIPLIGTIYVFNQRVFGVLTSILSVFSDEYLDTAVSATGATTMLLLFSIFLVFAYLVPKEELINRDMMGLRNFLLLSVVIQCFAPVHNLVMRMNYYYILFIPVLIPKLIDSSSVKYRQSAKIAEIVMCIFFTLYYVVTIYNSMQTGGALHTVPYVPFWR